MVTLRLPSAAVWLLVALGLALAAMACNSGGSGNDAYGERNPVDVDGNSANVEMSNLQFVPKGIRIKPGTTVTWVNRDAALHNVSSIDSVFLSAGQGDMKKGDIFSFTFDQAGTYRYQCTFHHPSMNGVVIVEE